MSVELKPVKILAIGSIILHAVALCALMILPVALQRPLWPFFADVHFLEESTLSFLPLIVIAPIVVVLILHVGSTLAFVKLLNNEDEHLEQLRVFSIVLMVAVAALLPIAGFIWTYVEHATIARLGMGSSDFVAYIVMRNLMNVGLVVRGISISVLLIAAAMAWHFCFIKRSGGQKGA